MEQTRQLFDGVHHARAGTIDRFGNNDDLSAAHRIQIAPAGEFG